MNKNDFCVKKWEKLATPLKQYTVQNKALFKTKHVLNLQDEEGFILGVKWNDMTIMSGVKFELEQNWAEIFCFKKLDLALIHGDIRVKKTS